MQSKRIHTCRICYCQHTRRDETALFMIRAYFATNHAPIYLFDTIPGTTIRRYQKVGFTILRDDALYTKASNATEYDPAEHDEDPWQDESDRRAEWDVSLPFDCGTDPDSL